MLQVPADYLIGIVPASDTGAVEMAMWSMLGERPVQVVAFESFGKDWVTDVVKQLKIEAEVLDAPYGKLPDLGNATKRLAPEARKKLSLWKHRNLVFGVPAIFMYLICEIGVGSLFVNFVSQPDIGNVTLAEAGKYQTLLWGGMAVGRFIGAWLMTFIEAETVLAGAALGAFGLLLVVVFGTGSVAMWALILVGLFHSIMFPTIFTLGIKGLGALTEEGSGLLIMAIAGGALANAQGWISDHHGRQISYLLPAVCELYALFYALWGCKTTNAEPPEVLRET